MRAAERGWPAYALSLRGHGGSGGLSSLFVAFCAGTAGMLSLTTAKSGALIGVLISVTTIPAAANIGAGHRAGVTCGVGAGVVTVMPAGMSLFTGCE